MKKLKENWDLTLLYKNDKDPRIEKDLQAVEKISSAFEKKYKGKNFTSSSKALKNALVDYIKLDELANGHKPSWYFNLKKDIDSSDKNAQAKIAQYRERYTIAGNKLAFFPLELGKTAVTKQKAYLKSGDLKDYSYLLKVIFDQARYDLTEKEEQLVSLIAAPGYSMWVDGNENLLSKIEIKHGNKMIPLPEAIGLISTLEKDERRQMHQDINQAMKENSHFSESEINAIYNFKKIMDERRGYAKPYSSTALHYENDEETVENLAKVVTKYFKLSQRFYKLHAKLLGEKKLSLSDRSVSIGKIKKKFSFDYSAKLVKDAFNQFDPKFGKIFQEFLYNGQLDVYPKKGKHGGAYCASSGLNPTYVLLNHTESIDSVGTLAHEMGHAFHAELSKSQLPHYRGHTTSTAEVASTFFEQVLSSQLEKVLSPEEQVILLHNNLTGDVSTIFRQIAFFNFELELHGRIRKEGKILKEEIAKLMNKHLKSYMGEVFDITEDDGYFFVYLSHMRRFFYVYSYAYGQIVSRALFEKWQADPSYSKKIEQFLRAGGSMSPKDIFKSIGIDTTDPKFFETGLKSIEKDIDRLEKLSKKV
ncbi:MAG: M3 family oligoendopeptidase [bacterium]|nr:M3 family oligoendopeptidase [bacterium]